MRTSIRHWIDTPAGCTISPRGYHPPSSQCYYHWIDTPAGWTISLRGYHPPSSQCYYHWIDTPAGWTISPRGYHPPSSQCYYHWIDTPAGGLLVHEGIILPVVSVSTLTLFIRYICYWNWNWKISDVIIINTKVIPPQADVTLAHY
jgi:hypothetical protein